MNWFVLRMKYQEWVERGSAQRLFELALSLLAGLLFGAMLIFSRGFGNAWQSLIAAAPIGFVVVMLVNDLEKLVLATIAVGVPLNLDISLMLSPYARNVENVARGHHTIVALTELRVSLVAAALVLGYALWLVKSQSIGHRPAKFFPATSIPALGLIFISTLSMFQARDLQLSFFRVVQLVELFLAYIFVANHLRTTEDIFFFLLVSTSAMLALSILMIVQWFTGLNFSIAGVAAVVEGSRVGGTFGNPGPAAGYLSAHLLITLATIWIFPKRSQRLLAVACLVSGCIALVSTGARIGWVGFAATLLLFIAVGLLRRWTQRTKLMLLLIGVLILALAFQKPILDRLTGEDYGSAESRPKMFRLAWNVIWANLWLGVGTNNYALVTHDYYSSDVGDLGFVIDSTVHNRYLLIWAESGLFALLFYVAFLGSAIIQSFRYVARSQDRLMNIIALGLGCALISLCIQMFTGTFHVRPITLFVWLLVALIASLPNLEQARSNHRRLSTLDKLVY